LAAFVLSIGQLLNEDKMKKKLNSILEENQFPNLIICGFLKK
jgi:hypothetical protein